MPYGLVSAGNYNPYPSLGAGSGLAAQNLATGRADYNAGLLAQAKQQASVASVPPPKPTVLDSTNQAIQAGTTAYSQLPGYAGDITNLGGVIAGETSGQVPSSVANQIAQSAAERGVGTGTYGSEGSNAALLQALGLTSLNLTQQGQSNLNTATAALPGAAISQNPSFFVTPALQQQAASQNAAAQTEANFNLAGLSAAQAGLGAGASGGGGAGASSFGALPPTPNTNGASNPTAGLLPPYAGVIPGYDPSGGNSSTGDNANLINQILSAYAGTIDPALGEEGNQGFSYFGGNNPNMAGGNGLEQMMSGIGASSNSSSGE